MCNCYSDCHLCKCVKTYYKDWNLWHKLYIDSFFFSPDFSDVLHMKAINCCAAVRPNWKVMPDGFKGNLTFRWGDLKTRVKGKLTAVVWKGKQNMKLADMHCLPAKANFCNQYGNTLKPGIIQDCNKHVGYTDKSGCITDCCCSSRHTWKWTKMLYFQCAHSVTVGKLDRHICYQSLLHESVS
jgi:hypothetical protein